MARRLTRLEQQRRTNTRLRVAGTEVFLRRGYLSTTVDELAAEAGYTRGAVYKHFGGKPGLWMAIVDAGQDEQFTDLERRLAEVTDRPALLSALADTLVPVEAAAGARWSTAAMEFAATAVTNPQQAAAIAARHARWDARLATLLTAALARLRLCPALPVDRLVIALDGLADGLNLRHAVDTDVNSRQLIMDVLDKLIPATESDNT